MLSTRPATYIILRIEAPFIFLPIILDILCYNPYLALTKFVIYNSSRVRT